MHTPTQRRRQGLALIAVGLALPACLWLFAWWVFGAEIIRFTAGPIAGALCSLSAVGPIVVCTGLMLWLANSGTRSEEDSGETR